MLKDLLTDSNVLSVLIEIAAALFSALLATSLGVKIRGVLHDIADKKAGVAFDYIEAGVLHVFQTLQAEIKRDADGKITKEDAARLRSAAVRAAIEAAIKERGKDVVTPAIKSDAMLNVVVESALASLKSEGVIPKRTTE